MKERDNDRMIAAHAIATASILGTSNQIGSCRLDCFVAPLASPRPNA
jgi:predicted nucleic acid-binding protein